MLAFIIQINAQEKTVVGKVTAFLTVPLKNVKISTKISASESFTDEQGIFSIHCSPNDVISIEASGFAPVKEKVVKIKDSLNVNLYFFNSRRNKELAVSNGHIVSGTLENAIANLPNVREDYSRYTDIFELINAKFPFVQYRNGSFFIPPATTGTGEVLLIYNGVEVKDISIVVPREVKSIKVLKGNDATIYGMRGANGVIEISTWEK